MCVHVYEHIHAPTYTTSATNNQLGQNDQFISCDLTMDLRTTFSFT